MRKVLKSFVLIAFTALAAACFGLALSACSKGGNESDSIWNRSDNIAMSFVRKSDCPDGNVNEEKLSAEMNCKLNEDYYMVIDFTIKAASDNDGRGTVDLNVNVNPSEVLSAKVREAESSKVTVDTTESGTNIKVNFSIPDKKSNVKNVRVVVELRATMEGQAKIGASLKNGSSQSVQLSEEGELTKVVNVGYTEGLTYRVSDDKYIVTGVSPNTLTNIVIPSETDGYEVVGIDNNAFVSCNLLREIVIPEGVKTIGDSAFSGCRSLESVALPDSVTEISANAFRGCTALKAIDLSEDLKTIGNNAFYGCSRLGSVVFGGNVQSIGADAFGNCEALTSVGGSDVASWCDIDFATETANPVSYAKQLTLGGRAVTNLFIPSSVKSIGKYAFVNCQKITSVVISENVKSVGERAFSGCSSVKTVVMGSKVKTVEQYAFSGCISLELVVMDNVSTVGDRAFSSCGNLNAVILGRSLSKVGNLAFTGCTKLSELTYKSSAARWGRVELSDGWRYQSGIKTVSCSDGYVELTTR